METTSFDAVPEQFPTVDKKKNADCFGAKLLAVNSWSEDAFKEQTKDHLKSIFEEMDIANKLGKGDSRKMISILRMPSCDQETGEFVSAMKRKLDGILEVCLEELDLMLFATKIGEKVLNAKSRKENVEILLKKLFGSEGLNASLEILEEFFGTGYTYIMERIKAMTGNRAENESLFGQEFFTAIVKLGIDRIESTGDMKMKIDLQDHKWHYIPVDPGNTSAADHKIVAVVIDLDCDTNMEIAAAKGKPRRKRKKNKRNHEKIHRNVLNRCFRKLLMDLDVDSVSPIVQEKELLNDVIMRDIMEQRTTTDKIRKLINQIQQRDPDTYKKFKECLVQAKQADLKELLEKEEQKILLK